MPRHRHARAPLTAITLLLVVGSAALAVARAQPSGRDTVSRPLVRLAVGGGVAEAAPFGGRGVGDVGYSLIAGVEGRTPAPGLRVRADALFANWGRGQHVSALTAGLVLRAPERWRAAPALTAAAGGYRASRGGGVSPGWSLGAGLRVPLGARAVLLESRIHAFNVGRGAAAAAGVSPFEPGSGRWQYTYTPLTFGVQF